mgnify:FL=1
MNIPVIINEAPHEKLQVAKLVEYCKRLDGTEVQIMRFDEPKGMRYPEIANWAFRQCAKAMYGTPFIWLEADSPPLVAGWKKMLEDEYERVGKPYLYAKTFTPPFDNFTGIGVQAPNAYDHVPEGIKTIGFDEHIVRNYPELVGRTDLIQHRYGSYDAKGDATLWEFPKDASIIRPDAIIFHKDQGLGIIDVKMPELATEGATNASSVGDAGDCFVSLATLQHRGGKYDYYLRDNGMTKGIVSRVDLVRGLIEAQPYINSVRIWKREPIAWASEGFRPKWHDGVRSLADCHAKHAFDTGFIKSMPDMSKQWLFVEPDKNWAGNVIVNRTERYPNDTFNWKAIVEHYGSRIVFIGLPHEHEKFCASFGKVRYRPTVDMLEVAQMIAGSALFIGNQSAAMTIAEGLKHPRIQESCLWLPDCIYPGAKNAQYVHNGACVLPDVDGSGEKVLKINVPLPSTTENPPGGWQFDGLPKGIMHPSVAINMICQQHPEWSKAEAEVKMLEFNRDRLPEFFIKCELDKVLSKFRLAMRNAGYSL